MVIKRGAGVYITINKTDGQGRRSANVLEARACAVDFDGTELPATWALEPHAIIETSPGRFHAWWFLFSSTDLTRWSQAQARLAAFYGGDPVIVDPARVLRVPGFDHQKYEPFRVRIVKLDNPPDFLRYTLEDIEQAHPCEFPEPYIPVEYETPSDVHWDTDELLERAGAFLKAAALPAKGERNHAAYAAACKLRDLAISPEKSLELLTEWNADADDPLPGREIAHVVDSASRYAQNSPGVDLATDPADGFRTEPSAAPSKKKFNAHGLEVIDASIVKPRALEFVWPGRIATGNYTVIAGQVVKLNRKFSTLHSRPSRAAVSGRTVAARSKVAAFCSVQKKELEDMIIPRLIAAGADMNLVSIVRAVQNDKKTGAGKFNLQNDLTKLERTCRDFGDVRLIGFDPISSYMGGEVDTHRNTAVRHVMDPITDFAGSVRTAVLSITHFNKNSAASAVNRVMESAAFINAPRAAFGIFDDPTMVTTAGAPTPRLMLWLKGNLDRIPPGLRYHVGTAPGGKDAETGKQIIAPRISWDGTTEQTADDVSAAQDGRGTPKRDQAKQFLEVILAKGPKPAAEVKKLAEAAGIKEDTLKQARQELAVIVAPIKGKMPTSYTYALPFTVLEDDAEDD